MYTRTEKFSQYVIKVSVSIRIIAFPDILLHFQFASKHFATS